VPGFRKGRAPRRLLEKRFGGEVSDTLVQQLVSTGYMAAIEKAELKALGDPLVYVKGDGEGEGEELLEAQAAIAKIKLPDEGPLVFSCEIEIRPEFELPATENIPLEKPILSVSDEDINTRVEYIRGLRGRYEPVEGSIKADDMVTADLVMSCEGNQLKEQTDVRLAARGQVVDGIVLEKLGDSLTGAKAGETVKIKAAIPDDYAKAELRGKEMAFEFKVKDVQRMVLPEVNEEFVKAFGFDTEEDLRKWIREDMEAHLGEDVKQVMRGEVSQYLLDNTSFDLPERLSNRQINQVTAGRILELYRRGVPPAEAEKMMDELKTSSREDAIRDLKLAFVMEKLAEQIEVEVTEGEINTMIAAIAQRQGQRFDRVRDELARQGSLTTLYIRLRDEKILDELISKATVTEAKLEDIKARKAAAKKAEKPAKAEKVEKAEKPAKSAKGESKAAKTDEGHDAPKVKRTPPKKKGKE